MAVPPSRNSIVARRRARPRCGDRHGGGVGDGLADDRGTARGGDHRGGGGGLVDHLSPVKVPVDPL